MAAFGVGVHWVLGTRLRVRTMLKVVLQNLGGQGRVRGELVRRRGPDDFAAAHHLGGRESSDFRR